MVGNFDQISEISIVILTGNRGAVRGGYANFGQNFQNFMIFDKNAKMKEHREGSSEHQFSPKKDAFRVSYGHFEFSLYFL